MTLWVWYWTWLWQLRIECEGLRRFWLLVRVFRRTLDRTLKARTAGRHTAACSLEIYGIHFPRTEETLSAMPTVSNYNLSWHKRIGRKETQRYHHNQRYSWFRAMQAKGDTDWGPQHIPSQRDQSLLPHRPFYTQAIEIWWLARWRVDIPVYSVG